MNTVQKIVIWGMGVTGQSLLKFAQKKNLDYICIDKKEPSSPTSFFYLEETIQLEFLCDFNPDAIVVSPGIDCRSGIWLKIKQKPILVLGEIEFVSLYSKVPVIAVTGTNGKSTTVNMISKALEISSIPHFLGGNWGIPYAEILEEKYQDAQYAILELSSFQLESIKTFTPLISVLLNITPSHMERYAHFEEYLDAKWNIFQVDFSRDFSKSPIPLVALLPTSQESLFFDRLKNLHRELRFFSKEQLDKLEGVFYSKAKLIGEHNKENFAVLYQVLLSIKCEKPEIILQKTIEEFKPIAHRLELCGQWSDILFFNDSKSTNITSTITAITSFQDFDPTFQLVLILGGKLRGPDVTFLEVLKNYSRINEIWTIGEASSLIHKKLSSSFKILELTNLTTIFQHLTEIYKNDSKIKMIILFSPSFPSFDQFKNFEERGNIFKKFVQGV